MKTQQREQRIIDIFSHPEDSAWKTIAKLFEGHYLSFLGSVIFFVIKHSPTWIVPIVAANIINTVTMGGEQVLSAILWNSVFLGMILLLNIPTHYIYTLLYAKAIREVERDLRSTLVNKLQQLSISYYSKTQSGRLQSKIMRDVEQVQNLFSQIFISVLNIIISIVVACIIVWNKNGQVFLFFMCTIPVAVFLILLFRKRIQEDNREFREEMEETSAKVMEMVELIPVTRAHALERHEISKIHRQFEKVAEKGLKLDMVQAYFGSISWVAFQMFQVICLGFTAYMAYRAQIGVGDITLYQNYFTAIVGQIATLVTLIPILAKGVESLESIRDVLRVPNVEENHNKQKLERVDGEITFSNVSFSYEQDEKSILQNFSLHIPKGETIAFVGSSGSGKTTIMNLAIGFLQPTDGKVCVDGIDLANLDLQSYRQFLSVVPQQSILFTGTIRENITYGMEDVSDETLWQIIRAANLEEVIAQMPYGLDTQISEHGSNLSGGQKQRISIARAFVRNPRILILDEATSALDTVSEKKIQNAVQNLAKGRTTLIVAHRLSTIRSADRIAVIGSGGLQEFGTYEELMARKGFFYQMQAIQTNTIE